MIQIWCDICCGSRKLTSGIEGDYKLWFTTIEINQICNETDVVVSRRQFVDICHDCRDILKGKPHEALDRLDDALLRGIRESIEQAKAEMKERKE